MKTLNISVARNTLPALVDSVSATHAPVVLLRYGKPAAMLVPVTVQHAQTNPYPLRGTPITVAKDFDAPLPNLWEACGVAEEHLTYGVSKKRSKKAQRKGKKA